jgi:hypothetical protein
MADFPDLKNLIGVGEGVDDGLGDCVGIMVQRTVTHINISIYTHPYSFGGPFFRDIYSQDLFFKDEKPGTFRQGHSRLPRFDNNKECEGKKILLF